MIPEVSELTFEKSVVASGLRLFFSFVVLSEQEHKTKIKQVRQNTIFMVNSLFKLDKCKKYIELNYEINFISFYLKKFTS